MQGYSILMCVVCLTATPTPGEAVSDGDCLPVRLCQHATKRGEIPLEILEPPQRKEAIRAARSSTTWGGWSRLNGR
jgi:hypothetical protein